MVPSRYNYKMRYDLPALIVARALMGYPPNKVYTASRWFAALRAIRGPNASHTHVHVGEAML